LTYVEGQVTFAISPLIRGISLARKILLADDSVTAQNMGRKILADAGYEVIAVNNGSAALKKIAELKPDLVILDVYMPGYSGLEVCQRLKESQETARIPVLLSVGKLEPFKPEEAQRVRAEAFIVKPFEASELLSALSKLEDKVVARAEPSKPGRFARAIAAAEEAGRGSRNETASDESGWKSRIGFPQQKTELEEKVADDSSIYNPMNRDLRTVVEKSAVTTADKGEKRQQAGQAAEINDVAALVPAGLPKDVTPEEVAAIAAAVAQIQTVGEAVKDENEAGHRRNGDERPEETQDAPVTMAATAESVVAASVDASRWTAVPVALEGEEATISLDQEMQKAYSASVAAEADPAALATVPQAEAAPAESSSAVAEAVVGVPVAAISNPEPEPFAEPERAMSAAAAAAGPAPDAQLAAAAVASSFVAVDSMGNQPASLPELASTSSQQPETAVLSPVTAEVAAVETRTEASSTPEFAESNQEPAPVAGFVSPGAETKVADLAGLVDPVALGAQELQSAPGAEPAMAEAATAASSAFALIVRGAEHEAEHEAEPKLDPEMVKSTATAWASWRQIRDTGKASETAPAQPKEFEVPESAPAETAARAVAAGAEQFVREVPAASSSSDPTAIASIVDSVLADLRPKLMEEISRKMAEKK
jgi:twitching motility two-component system response regulator PilH